MTGLVGAGSTPDEWVGALSDERSRHHGAARGWFEASRRSSKGTARGPFDPFLVPQVDYLSGLQHAMQEAREYGHVVELHALCTDRLTDDWLALMELLQSDANLTLPEWRRRRAEDLGVLGTATTLSRASLQSSLSRDERRVRNAHRGELPSPAATANQETRRIIRECMYPEDTRLLEMLCGGAVTR
eukprot:4843440-Prymnesium_polylepis.1